MPTTTQATQAPALSHAPGIALHGIPGAVGWFVHAPRVQAQALHSPSVPHIAGLAHPLELEAALALTLTLAVVAPPEPAEPLEPLEPALDDEVPLALWELDVGFPPVPVVPAAPSPVDSRKQPLGAAASAVATS